MKSECETQKLPDGMMYMACIADISRILRHPLHRHEFAEVFWVLDAEGTQWLNGSKQTLLPGMVTMIRPWRDCHRLECSGNKAYRIFNLAFSVKILREMGERYFPGNPDFWGGNDDNPAPVILSENVIQELSGIMLQLRHGPRNDRLLLDSFLTRLLTVVREYQIDPARNFPDWLRSAWRNIRKPEHFYRGNSRFVKLTGRTQEHTARELKRHAGMTISELINQVRLEHAAMELAASSRSISEIAFGCGYKSLSYFYTVFTRKYHVSPKIYRQNSIKI